MTSSSSLPPETGEEKSQTPYGDAAGAKALADVSEALNGLRELAERVTPAKTKSAASPPDFSMPLEAVPVQAEVAANDAPMVSIGVIAEKAALETAEAPVAIVIPPAPEPAAPPAAVRKPRVGETLRDARESAGFSLDDVADEIKIKRSYLQAIEEGRYDALPSRTYAVGWVRSYAQALGLNADEMVARIRFEVGALPKTAMPLVMREPVKDGRLPGGALITVCVVLAIVVYAVSYSFLRPSATPASYTPPVPEVAAAPAPVPVVVAPAPQPAPVVAVSAPVAAAKPAAPKAVASPEPSDDDVVDNAMAEEAEAPLPPTPQLKKKSDEVVAYGPRPVVIPGASPEDLNASPQNPVTANSEAAKPDVAAPVDIKPVKVKPPSRIKLRATADTEVRITDGTGRVLAARMIKKGESFYVPDRQHYSLATSNAGALRLSVDGREMAPLGDSGEAMHNIPLDAGDLLQVLAQ
jgi:cytoskeleton protein RodZ